jgi:hypothetical protein
MLKVPTAASMLRKECCVSMRATPFGHWLAAFIVEGGTSPYRNDAAQFWSTVRVLGWAPVSMVAW